ncbi:MAG: S8 family serine peptidase [Bacteroidales bacterium]|nr:S8 family serine peptidase [Bacteroidales bacterium]MCF8457983.1 S8 family serine peptidase [Bacteroidales bacterium]
MKKNGFLILCCLYLATGILSYGQSYVNMTWNENYGQPDTIDWMSTCLDAADNIIITGNKKAAGGNTNIYTAKYDTDGTLLWTKQYSYTSAQKDYGVAITTDGDNNIYIAGTSYVNSTNGYDFTVIMYDEDGNEEWVENYNGTGSGDDIATAIAEYDGDVFVTGISKGDTTLEDYVTIKYNSSGVQQWVSRYDYTNLVEIPAAIEIYDNGNVLITGASGSSIINWDITTVLYNNSTGSQMSSRRVTGSGYGFNQPADMRKDYLGNIIITGKVLNQQNNYDIKTIKMDANLDTIWTRTYNRDSLDDVPAAMDVDVNGKIYITGYSTKVSGADMINLQYDTNGDLTWSHIITAKQTNGIAKGKQIKVDVHGNFYATGEIDRDSTIDIITMRYDTARNLTWVKYFNGEGNGTDRPWDMICSYNGNAWVSGISYDGASETYTTIKYSSLKLDQEAETDTAGNPLFVKNQMIVAFDTSVINKQNIDNLDIQWGDAECFLKDTVIDAMKNVLPDGTVENANFIRIFRTLTTADSLSVTRLGDTVKVYPFWATLLMTLNDDDIEVLAVDSLNTLFNNVQYAEVNGILQLSSFPEPDDDEYEDGEQAGLFDPTFSKPDADINILPAWYIETGKDNIKVGVVDCGINYKHEDFGDGTFPGSKIEDGYDWIESCNVDQSSVPDAYGHGTANAGIIGALRNNDKGIAGIAGGDIDLNPNNTGAQLISLRVSTNENVPLSNAIDAITQGALSSGYGLHVMNNSYGGVNANTKALRLAVETASQNNVVFVAPTGNDGQINVNEYPASYSDDWVIKVGASNSDGKTWFWSNHGGSWFDFIAPGTEQIFATCDHDSNTGYTYSESGTSHSCAHVSGVAALFLSYVNNHPDKPNNLAPEDVENIMQNYINDVNDGGSLFTPGYDDYSGYGLLDAGNAMQHLELPKYKVRHAQVMVNTSYAVLVESNKTMLFPEQIPGLASTTYSGIADVYKLTASINQGLPVTENVIGAWVRNSSTYDAYGYSDFILNPHYNYATVDSWDQNGNITISCYIYHIEIYNYLQQHVATKWFPNVSHITFAYSFHTDDEAIGIDEIEYDDKITIYPNPANNFVNIVLALDRYSDVNIQLYDVQGKLLQTNKHLRLSQGDHKLQFNIDGFVNGIYILQVQTNDEIINKKIIKR